MNRDETGCELFIDELTKCGWSGPKKTTSKNSIPPALLLDDVLSAGHGFMKSLEQHVSRNGCKHIVEPCNVMQYLQSGFIFHITAKYIIICIPNIVIPNLHLGPFLLIIILIAGISYDIICAIDSSHPAVHKLFISEESPSSRHKGSWASALLARRYCESAAVDEAG